MQDATPAAHMEAIERIARLLRRCAMQTVGFARFHGGGRGAEGWLDHALGNGQNQDTAAGGFVMAIARCQAGPHQA